MYNYVQYIILHNTVNYATGLCTYYTILFIIILQCTLSTSTKVCCQTVCCVMLAAAPCILFSLHLVVASFSLVLDLISCCFV